MRTANSRGLSLAALLPLISCALQAAPPQPYSRQFRVHLVDDSAWGHCELEISRWEGGPVKETVQCRNEDGPYHKGDRVLSSQDVSSLTAALHEAKLFEGQFWGADLRGLDAALVSLTVDDGARVATVIASSNPTFEGGARQLLLTDLVGRVRRSIGTSSGPTKR